MTAMTVKQTAGFIQTERATHEAWGKLTMRKPAAAALMHVLVSNVGQDNAVTASYNTLAELVGCSPMTIRRAIDVLRDERWIEVVQIGGSGSANSYVLNSKVAWHEKRDKLRFAKFSSTILASASEQPDRDKLTERASLRRIPSVLPGERQLPSGDGLPPISQPALPGMEPELPAMQRHYDPVTGKVPE